MMDNKQLQRRQWKNSIVPMLFVVMAIAIIFNLVTEIEAKHILSSVTIAVVSVLAFVVYLKAPSRQLENALADAHEKEKLLSDALEQIRQSEAHFRQTLDMFPIPVTMTQAAGSAIFHNRAFADQFGYTIEDLPDVETWINTVYEDPDYRDLMVETWIRDTSEAMATGTTSRTSIHKIIAKDGSRRILEVFMQPIGQYYVNVFTDITERLKAEEERILLTNKFHQAQKLESLGALSGGIAHDFNNLMSGVFGCIELALDTSTDSDVKSYLEMAVKGITRARDLTHQLLTFANGGAPMQEVGTLFPFVEDIANFALNGSNCRCSCSVAKDLAVCSFDQKQLGLAIENMVLNSQQAMPHGGEVTIVAENITAELGDHINLAAGEYVRISIEDHGVGIDSEHLSHVFDPFFTTKEMGRGLGLSTSYSIVKRHGGTIEVTSVLGQGSTFCIYLPVTESAGTTVVKSSEMAVKNSGTIIAMDDEKLIRFTIEKQLSQIGYTALTASDGSEAIELFQKERLAGREVTALIFDLTVPNGMGGVKAAQEIRKIDSEIPVFVASGYSDDPVMVDPVAYGFTASISKPFGKQDLEKLLGRGVGMVR